ncbi:dolichol kinase-like [Babylonia areolata]|uniref:dolichol kinase-like n=1 Tax=Babylonia areolata TaxID=304850 RepID=UPI003FD32F0B
MESSSTAKRGIRGEETLTAILFLRAVVLLLLKSQSKEWFTISDWEFVVVSSCLLLQLLTVYNFPSRKKEDHTEIVFRPWVNNGLYCVLLVPLAVVSEVISLPSADGGSTTGFSEVLFLLATVCALLLMAPWQLKRTFGILYLLLVLSSTIIVISLRIHKGGNSLPWLTGFTITICAAYYLPHMCPWSFTYGELCVVCQIIGSAVFRMGNWMDRFIFNEEWPVVTNEMYVYVFVSVLVVFVVLASALVLYWDWCDNIVPFVLVYFAFALIAVGVLILLTGHNPILWLFWFIFGEHRRVSLLAWWSAVAIITIISFSLYTQHVSNNQSGNGGRASTAARKVFHLVVVSVYIPGLVVDPYFLLLASVVALAALGVLEISRLISVQWLGSAVDNSFRVFVDDRDQGPVLLTHIYLLVGLSLPLWLSHNIVVGDVRNFCGVISLGIGDTIACVVGMKYGNTKWPGTKKSIEGTAASLVAQLLFVLLAFYVGWLEEVSWISTLFSVITSSVFEAFVSQIDNLLLPVYMLAALPPVSV